MDFLSSLLLSCLLMILFGGRLMNWLLLVFWCMLNVLVCFIWFLNLMDI